MPHGLLNVPADMTEAGHLLRRAIDAFRQQTGLDAKVHPYEPRGLLDAHDAIVEIQGGREVVEYLTDVKLRAIDRFEMLGALKEGGKAEQGPFLLVVPYMTQQMAERCVVLNLPFLDAAGNAYLNAPGLYVCITGKKRAEIPELAVKTPVHQHYKPTGLRIIFALLMNPALANANYREIAKAAGVALGTVGWVFREMRANGHLHETQGGERRLLDPLRLMKEWAQNYPVKLRPKLNTRRFRAPGPDWWKHLDVATYRARWGSEVAADRLTGYLKPGICTLYVHGEPNRLILDQRLRPDFNGEVEVLEAFWDEAQEAEWDTEVPAYTVPPLLVYADLMATTDARNLETARMIYERYLATT